MRKALYVFAGVMASAPVLSSINEIWLHYSPEPRHIDDNQFYIAFNHQLDDGGIVQHLWWEMWDGDIPILARLIGWIDYHSGFPHFALGYCLNVAMLFAIVGMWLLYAVRLGVPVFIPLSLALTFSWFQSTNFIYWISGVMWFPNVLISLAAFYCLARDYFWPAVMLGVLAIITTANGLLVLPLMAALVIMLGMGWHRARIIIGIWLVCCGFYAADWFFYPAWGVAERDPISTDVGKIAYNALMVIGAPTFYVPEPEMDNKLIESVWAGIAMLSSIPLLIAWWWHQGRNRLQAALGGFTVLFIGTAVMMAIGRTNRQYGGPFIPPERYATIILAGWQAFALLALSLLRGVVSCHTGGERNATTMVHRSYQARTRDTCQT